MSENSDGRSRLASLASISRGASLYTVGKVVADAGEFLLHLLVSRWLGAASYGLFAYGKTLAFTALLLTNLGSDKSILRHLPQYENQPAKRRFFLGLAWVTSAVGGTVVAVALFVSAPIISDATLADPMFVDVLRLFALVLFVDTLANLLYATFRAVELIEYEILGKRLLKPLLRVCGVGSVLVVGGGLYGVVAAMVAASVVTLVVTGYLLYWRLDIRPTLRSKAASRESIKEYYSYSLPLTAKEAGTVMQGRIDVLMVGFFLSSTAVGIYNVSVLVASVLYVPLLAVNQLFPPIASRLYTDDKRADLQAIYTVTTRWILTASLLLGLTAVVFRQQILGLFGSEFVAGSLILVALVAGQLLNAATGPSDYLLMMTDHQYVVMANEWIFGITNVVLNIVFIQAFGLIGAALASGGVLAVRNVTKVSEVWYFERLHPYSWSFRKPIAAGLMAAGGMVIIEALLAGMSALLVGIVVGTILYGGCLWLFGIEAVDYRLFGLLTDSPSE